MIPEFLVGFLFLLYCWIGGLGHLRIPAILLGYALPTFISAGFISWKRILGHTWRIRDIIHLPVSNPSKKFYIIPLIFFFSSIKTNENNFFLLITMIIPKSRHSFQMQCNTKLYVLFIVEAYILDNYDFKMFDLTFKMDSNKIMIAAQLAHRCLSTKC